MTMQLNGTTGVTTPASVNFNNVPAFSAFASSVQTIPNSLETKVSIDTEEYDTNSNFSTATNRFTPTVAGYYQVNVSAQLSIPTGAGNGYVDAMIYKSGSLYKFSATNYSFSSGTTSFCGANCSSVVYMNGSTDYIEFYLYINNQPAVSLNTNALSSNVYFQACLVRSA